MMMRAQARIGLLSICLAVMLAGSAGAAVPESVYADSGLPTIKWNIATLRLIAPGGDYGRMARLADGSIVCGFDRDRKMWIQRSTDSASTWSKPVLVAQNADSWLTNAALLPLRDGSLLYFWNDRPLEALRYEHHPAPPGTLTKPICICMSQSRDGGRTWSAPRTIYAAGPSFQDGCWEPAAIQLPSDEIQLYFSNEFPFPRNDDQEISLMRSLDSGTTWSHAQCISHRSGHRDGMPAPLVLTGGGGIAFAIEDNGSAGGRFKPSIIYSSLKDNWHLPPADANSQRRWPALLKSLDPEWYAGAPFLAQLASGLTLLSYQQSADGGLDHCRMAVSVGDAAAKNFTHTTYPIPPDPDGNQAWNALFVLDARTVIAISTATVNSRRGIWTIEGHIQIPSQNDN